jgi:hypothetical protein
MNLHEWIMNRIEPIDEEMWLDNLFILQIGFLIGGIVLFVRHFI